MDRKLVAIEIGDKILRICEVSNNKKTTHVYKKIMAEIPSGVVQDGEIKDVVNLAGLIKDKLNEAKISNRKVAFCLTSNKIASKEVVVTRVKKQEIRHLIELNATEYFPIKIDDYTIGYNILQMHDNDDKKMRLFLAAFPNEIIKSYYALADLIGLSIQSIDYAGNSSLQLYKRCNSKEVNLLIQICDNNTYATIIREGAMELQRTIPYGSSQIIDTVLDNPFEPINSYVDAIKYMKSNLVAGTSESPSLNNQSSEVGILAESESEKKDVNPLQNTFDLIDTINGNIIRLIEYYASRNEANRIGTIYFADDGVPLLYMQKKISERTGIPVVQYTDFLDSSNIFDKNKEQSGLSKYLFAIGASINPVSIEQKKDEVDNKKDRNIRLTVASFVILVAISGGLSAKSFLDYRNITNHKKDVEKDIKQLEGIVDIYNTYKDTSKKFDEYDRIYQKTLSKTDEIMDIINELEKVLPTNSRVNNIQVNSDNIVLNMQTSRKEVIAQTLSSLRSEKYFSKVTNAGFTQQEDENGLISVSYTVECYYSDLTENK